MKKLLILLAILIFCFDCFKAMNEKQPNDTDIFLDATDDPADLKATQAEDRLKKDLGTAINHKAKQLKDLGLQKAKSLGAGIQNGIKNIDTEELADSIFLATAANLHEDDPSKILSGAAKTLAKGMIDQQREKLAEDDGIRELPVLLCRERAFEVDVYGKVQKGQKEKDGKGKLCVKQGWELQEIVVSNTEKYTFEDYLNLNCHKKEIGEFWNKPRFWDGKKLVFYDKSHIANRHRKNLMYDAATIGLEKLTGEEKRSIEQAAKQTTVKNFVGYMNERYGNDPRNYVNYGNNYNEYSNYPQPNQFNHRKPSSSCSWSGAWIVTFRLSSASGTRN